MNAAVLAFGRSGAAGRAAYGAPHPRDAWAVAPRRRVHCGEILFLEGDRCRSLYRVRSGTFKTTVATPDAGEQVTGFQLAGDMLGLDGLASDCHASTAVALEDSEVVVFPHTDTELEGMTPLQASLPHLLARELVRKQKLAVLLSCMNAEQRVASFLLNLSHRLHARGYSATEFHLRMTRREIGSYLGVKIETVSRTFTEMHRRGLLRVDGRSIVLLDRQALLSLFDELPLRARVAATERVLHA
ncbi:helix-turn-helix domain-containing protein [Ramlibacter alkalitolerans]|uniref:Helix-turn-helix domain-containing protein n=1 Tax=Ramlibacter alkalitolerans TaxID=2039631 RepID=A0ABS1JM43_9BURK|nr:helix-turn-helix domain-containing protein [Ramlibacter alkalitolerans]MBL0425196.1 helix-turn-helix domain-containing protein [Ramlibacter alkalitolerans]